MKWPIFPYAKLIAHVMISYNMLDHDPDTALEVIKEDLWSAITSSIESLRKEAKKLGIKPSERLQQKLSERLESDEPVFIAGRESSKVGLTESR